jgi:hypothetical protein
VIDLIGCKEYYVSFIDGYSKFTWLYLLHKKSDVFKFFLKFQSLVERMFNKKIIPVQSDWGGEFEHVNSYFHKLDITHQVSYPHTHQQNGVVQRKHRHIVEMGLALLAHASIALKYWDEAFITAYISSTTPPPNFLPITLPSTNFLRSHLIILVFRFLGVPTGQTFVHIIPTNYNSVSSIASSLGTTTCTRVSNA